MKKKILSIFLSLAVAITMMPIMAGVSFAGETTAPVELVNAQTSGSKAIKLSWNNVSGATKYVIYGQKCGKSFKKLKTTSNTSYKVKKIKGKKLKSHKAYKFYVVAYNGSKKIVSSKSIHFITGKTMGKYANARSIAVKPTSLTLEKGQTATLKATTKIYKNKKHVKTSHGAKTRYISDNPSVASVNAKGTVTAKAGGTATIYVQDIGGLWCKTTVNVQETKTISDILPDGFPIMTEDNPASGAWTDTQGESPKYCYLTSEGNSLRFMFIENYKDIDTDGAVLQDGDKYVYTDSTITITFAMLNGELSTITFADEATDTWDGEYSTPACIAAGTMISMADGSQKAVEEVEVGDSVHTFNHKAGEASTSPVAFVWESGNVTGAFTLIFEDGIEVTVIEEHGFYDQEKCKYVFINSQNAKDYIGHHFYNGDTENWLELKACEILSGSVDAYAIITSGDLNHMSNGMLSMCDGTVKVLANLFDYDDQMKFDENKKNKEIETYGLMPIEKILELEGFTETDYYAYNMQYMSVAIGKGLITWEWLEALSDYCVANGL